MTALELREGHFGSFFDVPFQIYGERYPFVSQLEGDLRATLSNKNPLIRSGAMDLRFYTALRDGRPVGRIVAHVHHTANQRFNERTACFGYFDCADDVDVARRLLEAAEAFGRSHGCTRVRGNMNLTANQEMGVLVEGEQRRPGLAQIWNPEYLPRLLEACGYARLHPMTSFFKDDVHTWDGAATLEPRHRALQEDKAYRFRPFELKRFDAEVESIRQVLNEAMDGNYLFVPMTPDEARFQLGPLQYVLDPKLTRMVEHEGQVVGVALGVPDLVPLLRKMGGRLLPLGWWYFLMRKRIITDATIIIILTRKAYQSKGLIRVLTAELLDAARRGNYRTVYGTWIGDDNLPSLKAANAIGMKPYHRLFMFERDL